jgi:hypothetical protein
MALVNGDCLPIPVNLASEIAKLCTISSLDFWNPWPALTKLKYDGLQMKLRDDGEVGLDLCYGGTSVLLKVDNAAAICLRYTRIGFEHSTLVYFAALLLPTGRMNTEDPWNALMLWKQDTNVHLEFSDSATIKCIQHVSAGCCSAGSVKLVEVPPKMFNSLVALFNTGDIPPGCTTAWGGIYYTADEALPLLEKAYGTPEFEKLIARFQDGKLRRFA